jgi:hypothetical protein
MTADAGLLTSHHQVPAWPGTRDDRVGGGAATHPQSGDIASVEAERDRELSAGAYLTVAS